MAATNHERVGKAMELLRNGLGPFVEREFQNLFKGQALAETGRFMDEDRLLAKKAIAEWDVAALLRLMWEAWNEVFRRTLGHSERTLVSELRDARNRWAHQEAFSSDDAYRVLDSTARLLTAVSAEQADEVEKMKMELLRQRFDEQVRGEKRKVAGTAIESQAATALKPGARSSPRTRTCQRSLPAGRVRRRSVAGLPGRGTDEYRDPAEFFRRTYPTESLKRLLVGAVRRLSGAGGDPVVQLQTNFGGGKTHSMLALYHLFSGIVARRAGGCGCGAGRCRREDACPRPSASSWWATRSPRQSREEADGTMVRTLWGELAWQLGGKQAYARLKADDEKATSPGICCAS